MLNPLNRFIIGEVMSRLTIWSRVAGRTADIAFSALHAPYIVRTDLWTSGFYFEYTINSSWGQKQKRDIELHQRRKNKLLCSRYYFSKYYTRLESIASEAKSRDEISSYIKKGRINFSVPVVVFLNIELG